MKYIRTKDGKIYELQETKNGEKYLVRNGELIPLWNTKAYEIFNQADTIEELCDEFVVFGDIDRPYLTRHKFINKEWNKQYFIGDRKLYGAIWTKGEHGEPILKSVAKMNDKGELELL